MRGGLRRRRRGGARMRDGSFRTDRKRLARSCDAVSTGAVYCGRRIADVERMTIIPPRARSPPGSDRDRTQPSMLPRDERLALLPLDAEDPPRRERVQALYSQGDMRCPTHFSIGQEAVGRRRVPEPASGRLRHQRPSLYAHYIGKGGNPRAMFAELYGKVDGCALGQGRLDAPHRPLRQFPRSAFRSSAARS